MELKTKEYYEGLDKRTKEFKEYKKGLESVSKETSTSKGVGDTVEKITEATGIKKLVNKLFGPDCGCEERKEKLNKLFKYKTECLEEDEYNYLTDLFDRLRSVINIKDQRKVLVIYNRVFNQNRKASTCAPCWISIIREIKKLVEQYDIESKE